MEKAAAASAATETHADRLLATASEMVPRLRERADGAGERSRIPEETIAELQEAGFFRVLQPRRYGGYELPPEVFFRIQIELARGCMSTAWVYGVIGVHPFQLALFDDKAQSEVWGEDPSVLVASSYQPVGKVQRVEGGFRLSGHWSFSSGCQHCDWIFLGAVVPPERDGDPPDMRTFLLPKSDYRIERAWHVFGLQATGSEDIVVEDAFVPEYRTHRAVDGFTLRNPGYAVNDAPMYRIPWAQVFVRSVCASAIGAAEAAVEHFTEIARRRVSSVTREKAAGNPEVQQAIARALMSIDELKLVLYRDLREMGEDVEAGRETSVERRVRYRYHAAQVVQRCIDIVDPLLTLCGGRGIYLANPLVRIFQDLHAGRAHVANEPTRYANNLGAVMIGHENSDFFI